MFCAVLSHSVLLTLCDPMEYSPPGSSVHEILQTRILEWVGLSFSRGSSQPSNRAEQNLWHWHVGSLPLSHLGSSYISYVCVFVCVLSHVQLFSITCQASLSVKFSRQEYWSWLPFSTHPSLGSPALAGGFFATAPPGKPFMYFKE